MARRSGLLFDQEGLAQNLKASTGRGVDALFSPPPENPPSSPPPEGARDGTPRQAAANEQATERAPGPEPETRGDSPPPSTAMTSEDRAPAAVAPRHHDPAPPRPREGVSRVAVRRIRKAVRQVGKEAATHRFTAQEKARLLDIVYTYARRGCRSSENELVRIGVNWLLDDYQENGERSVLHIVLRALKA